MPTLTLREAALIPWYIFCAYWIIAAFRVKRAKATEKPGERLTTIAVMIGAYVLLFEERVRLGSLDLRFLPSEPWIPWAGMAMTGMGVAFAVWARHCIGEYWSGRVTLKEGHQLIRSGPYKWVRHPIYTGLLLAVAGRAITVAEWRALVGVTLVLLGFSYKALREERLLSGEFGQQYAEFRRNAGFLFPRLRNLFSVSGGDEMDTSARGT